MLIKLLNELHPTQDQACLQKWSDLYAGGDQFLANAQRYLIKRPKEEPEDYGVRCRRAFYIPYVSAVIEFFAANLFAGKSEVSMADGSSVPTEWQEFLGDVDGRGTDWDMFWREQFSFALRDRWTIIAPVFKKVPVESGPKNLLEEEKLGNRRPYLQGISRADVNDWEQDDIGRFSWMICKNFKRRRPTPEGRREGCDDETQRWVVARTHFVDTFERSKGSPRSSDNEQESAAMISSQAVPEFPLVQMCLPQGMWVMNNISSLAVELFNKWNDLSWKLQCAAFPQRIVKTHDAFNQIAGASYFFQIKPGESIEYLEPGGSSYSNMETAIERLETKLYATVHQIAQGVRTAWAAGAESGESKRRDREPMIILLRAYGHIVREAMEQTLNLTARLRGDADLKFSVRGIDQFDISDLSEFVDNYLATRDIVKSPTWHRAMRRNLALKQIVGEAEEVRERVSEEESDDGDGMGSHVGTIPELNPEGKKMLPREPGVGDKLVYADGEVFEFSENPGWHSWYATPEGQEYLRSAARAKGFKTGEGEYSRFLNPKYARRS